MGSGRAGAGGWRTIEAIHAVGELQRYLQGVREHDARVAARRERKPSARMRLNLLAPTARPRAALPSPEVQALLAAACEASAGAAMQAPRVDLFALLTRTRAA